MERGGVQKQLENKAPHMNNSGLVRLAKRQDTRPIMLFRHEIQRLKKNWQSIKVCL